MNQSRTVMLLSTAAVALIGLNAYLVATPVDTSPLQDGPPLKGATEFVSPSETAGHGDLSQTTARPLFAADRRPPVKAEAASQSTDASQAAPQHLELRGVMRRGGRMQALIRSGDDPAGHWIAVGGTHEGLHLREIKGDVAIIEARGERYELPMTYRRADNRSGSSPPQ